MPKRSKGVLEASIEHERSIARAIGDRMRERRIQLELSQGTVRAKLKTAGIHISRSQYSRIEQGESLLNAAEIIALTHTLDMSCQWLGSALIHGAWILGDGKRVDGALSHVLS